MKTSLLCCCLVFILHSTLARDGHDKSRPNIVIILGDDMGFDDVSFRGNKEFITPNIDAVALHGMNLHRLYAPSICTPSRGALMTGRYPIHTGTQHNVISNENPWALPTNVTTIAEIFRGANYSTNLVGKWHLGHAKQEYTPTARGFDYHYGYWGGFIDYYQRRSKMPVVNTSMGYDFRRNLDIECNERGKYVTDLLTDEAVRIIADNNGTQPLFMIVNHLAPHTANEDDPLQAPADEIQKFMHISDPEHRKYAAMVSKLDTSVGQIVQALDRSGMLNNSILIYYSDNGAPAVGMFANSGSNWPLRGQKNSPWEGGVRVAGAIWSTKLKSRGSIFRQPMYVGDWLPTLAHAADIALDNKLEIDGINLWPQLSAPAPPLTLPLQQKPLVPREIVHFLDDTFRVVSYMRGSWKYINGSTLNGIYDSVLTYREEYETDPRDARYASTVRNSLASQSLQKYDKIRLTRLKIERLRREAAVRCEQRQRGCNAMLEECLFKVDEDACEQNNLAHDARFKDVLLKMRAQVNAYRRSAWPQRNQAGKPEYDPARHNCVWTTFLEEPATEELAQCGYFGAPCEAA